MTADRWLCLAAHLWQGTDEGELAINLDDAIQAPSLCVASGGSCFTEMQIRLAALDFPIVPLLILIR